MSAVAVPLVQCGIMLLAHLPQIIKGAQDLYALWRSMRGTHQQNDPVLRAMKLLNRHHDDIDRLLQNPEEKRALLEGLTILMNRINEHDASQAHLSDGDCGTSFKPSKKGGNWRECDVCCSTYNLGVKRPTILICGHTFCRSCLVEVSRRGPLLCPTCRTHETRSLTALPPNTILLSALEDDDQGDDSCCSGGGSASSSSSSSSNSGSSSCSNSSSSYNSSSSGGCNGMPMSFEQQIEYAIFLSQQQAQSYGTAYVEASWREVEEAEDERLARALQDSEIYEASRLCFQRQVKAATGGLNPPDKGDKECGACGGSQAEPSAPPASQEEDDEASMRLAIELHQQEMASSQSLCGNSCRGDSCASDGSSSCDGGWMREYQNLFGPAYCRTVEEGGERVQKEKQVEERSNKGEEDDIRDEENAVRCSMNQEEERKEGKKEDECASKCNEDDCCTKEGEDESSRLVKAEEELLIQMAIQFSLEQQEASQPPAVTARE